jgi:hypothetical protein
MWHLSTVPPAQLFAAEAQLLDGEQVSVAGVHEQDWHEPPEHVLEQVPWVEEPKAG